MNFEIYIKESGKTQAEVAKELDTDQGSISRWCSKETMPRPFMIKKITEWSGGKVQPNDFYVSEE